MRRKGGIRLQAILKRKENKKKNKAEMTMFEKRCAARMDITQRVTRETEKISDDITDDVMRIIQKYLKSR